MNWSAYSRYVGDVFGAPLAIEGLAAFFVESTFLGLWIFGRDRLSPRVHTACIWMVAFGTMASAYFILAANSWMQHPVGYELDPVTGQARMNDVVAVLTQKTALFAFGHTILAAWVTAGMVVIGISAWYLRQRRETELARRALAIALPATCAAAIATTLVGHFNGQLMTDQQPMKMAAAEALWNTEQPAGLSVFATGDFSRNPGGTNHNLVIPHVLSLIATNDPNGKVEGINEIQDQYVQRYGPGDYVPVVGVTYWTWRAMMGMGFAMILLTARGRVAGAPAQARDLAPLAVAGDRRHGAAVHRQLGRLAVHRDGAPAVGRLRAAAHRGRRLAQRLLRGDRDHADRLQRRLRRSWPPSPSGSSAAPSSPGPPGGEGAPGTRTDLRRPGPGLLT